MQLLYWNRAKIDGYDLEKEKIQVRQRQCFGFESDIIIMIISIGFCSRLMFSVCCMQKKKEEKAQLLYERKLSRCLSSCFARWLKVWKFSNTGMKVVL